jgi:hypothetical protein
LGLWRGPGLRGLTPLVWPGSLPPVGLGSARSGRPRTARQLLGLLVVCRAPLHGREPRLAARMGRRGLLLTGCRRRMLQWRAARARTLRRAALPAGRREVRACTNKLPEQLFPILHPLENARAVLQIPRVSKYFVKQIIKKLSFFDSCDHHAARGPLRKGGRAFGALIASPKVIHDHVYVWRCNKCYNRVAMRLV